MKSKESFITKENRERREISELINQCDDQLEKLRFLEVKRDLLGHFQELRACKTDLQKALQLDAIKKYLKDAVSVLIQENYKYKEIISSSKIINEGLQMKSKHINGKYNEMFREFNGFELSNLDSKITELRKKKTELNLRLKELTIEKDQLLKVVKQKKFYNELMIMRMEYNGLLKHQKALKNKKELLKNIM